MSRYSPDEMTREYRADEPLWFSGGDFLLSPARARLLISKDLVEQVDARGTLYRRAYPDTRMEAKVFKRALHRFSLAPYQPPKVWPDA